MAIVEKPEKARRSEVVNLRIEPSQRDLIDAAAALCGKTRSAFMLDAAYQAAEETLLDRRVFALNEEQWEAFKQALDNPPAKNEKLAKLLATKSPWE
jgi:uncharacterized protein (DUF1778 family)